MVQTYSFIPLRSGKLSINIKLELIHLANKPESFISDLVNCGIYILSDTMVAHLEEANLKKSNVNSLSLYVIVTIDLIKQSLPAKP